MKEGRRFNFFFFLHFCAFNKINYKSHFMLLNTKQNKSKGGIIKYEDLLKDIKNVVFTSLENTEVTTKI